MNGTNGTRAQVRALVGVFSTPFFLGMAPIFGKLALHAGADAFGIAALRTLVAVSMLWCFYLLFLRQRIVISPAGLLGCVIIGMINGIGSLFYYGGLTYLPASLVQLLNGMYLPIAVLLAHLGGHRIDYRTMVRVLLAVLALLVLTGLTDTGGVNWLGVGLMLASALMFAGTFMLSQYVLVEMHASTGALYILTAMGVVVTVVWLAVGADLPLATLEAALPPIVALGITTALSRLAMFINVKTRGSVETAAVAITEIAVALVLAALVLGDVLSPVQWVGAGLLFWSMLLTSRKDLMPQGYTPAALLGHTLSSVQFQRIAFHKAFGTHEPGVMATLTSEDLLLIQRMMGVKQGPVDPFPIDWKGGYRIDMKSFLSQNPPADAPSDKPPPQQDDA